MRISFIAGLLVLLLAGGNVLAQTAGDGASSQETADVQEVFIESSEGAAAEEMQIPEETPEGESMSSDALEEDVDLEDIGIIIPDITFADFTDIEEGAWYVPYARAMIELGIVSGYRDEAGEPLGLFGPNDPVTVGQLLKMSMEAAGIDTKLCSDPQVEATIPTKWIAPYVVCAAQMEIRILEKRVLLDRPILRGEALGLIHDVFRITAPNLPIAFEDTATSPYRNDIAYDAAREIVSGPTDFRGKPRGVFLPNNTLNRAEVSKILFLTIHADEMSGPVGLSPITLDLYAKNYTFSPSTLVVQRGQKVTLNIHNAGRHTFNIDELNIHMTLSKLEETLTFTALESGTFDYYCEFEGHTAAGMIGQLIVK